MKYVGGYPTISSKNISKAPEFKPFQITIHFDTESQFDILVKDIVQDSTLTEKIHRLFRFHNPNWQK